MAIRRMTRGRVLVIVVAALIAGALAFKVGPTLRERNLPPYATAEFIDRHFRPQLEALRRYASSGKLPEDAEADELFHSAAIRSAMIYTHYGEKSRRGIAVKTSPLPEAVVPPSPDSNAEGTFVVPTNDGSIHYERRFRVEGALRGFELVLEARSLQKLQ